MTTIKTIHVTTDFNSSPKGRYEREGFLWSGTRFRTQWLHPALLDNDKVIVDLNGYNRYGRSFLDEAFGGLIREHGFTKVELDTKLEYIHDLLPSLIEIIDERIDDAERDRINKLNKLNK